MKQRGRPTKPESQKVANQPMTWVRMPQEMKDKIKHLKETEEKERNMKISFNSYVLFLITKGLEQV